MHQFASLFLLVAAVERKSLLPVPAEEITYHLTRCVISTMRV